MPSHVEYYKDLNNQWRWRAIATNGKTVADSGEGYHNLEDCKVGYLSAITTKVEEQ
jgi:uncharacterized protein YegP (UPF0339 family)